MDEIPTVMEDCTDQPLKPNMVKLYKFRSLQRFEYVEDIIMNQRFYMTSIADLNDPMEGVFHSPGFDDGFRRAMERAKEQYRVCSFSRGYASPVCWAHYADSFKGICIEIETDYNRVAWSPVEYRPSRIVIDESNMYAYSVLPQFLLQHKLKAWEYEQEMRAILPIDSQYLPARGKWTMKRVLLGVRTLPEEQERIRRIAPPSVSVWTTRINDKDEIENGKELCLP